MLIQGLQKLTLLDYPTKLAATVFLGGCNMRCPFCHNASLVVRPSDYSITEEEFFSFLESRKGRLEAVCVSGGEPTLRPELPSFINRIKEMGFLVKLDTNGTNPKIIRSLVEQGLLDYVAMDIKNSPESYSRTAGISVNMDAISESVSYLLSGKVDYEFRTTVVKGYHTKADFESIGRWISGARAYFIQTFKDSGDIIEKGLEKPCEIEVFGFLEAVKPYVPNAQIRG